MFAKDPKLTLWEFGLKAAKPKVASLLIIVLHRAA
jgi:hypothetical protein